MTGFGKIIGGYEFQINYDESKKPSFRSDRYQFTVVMPNLNYNVPQDVPRNVPQKKESNPLEIQILNMIKKDNKISTEKNGNDVRNKFQDCKTSHQRYRYCPVCWSWFQWTLGNN